MSPSWSSQPLESSSTFQALPFCFGGIKRPKEDHQAITITPAMAAVRGRACKAHCFITSWQCCHCVTFWWLFAVVWPMVCLMFGRITWTINTPIWCHICCQSLILLWWLQFIAQYSLGKFIFTNLWWHWHNVDSVPALSVIFVSATFANYERLLWSPMPI